MDFLKLGLSPVICKILEKQGFTTPTFVQQQTIPQALEGRDLLVSAQTGTGKTASFLLPLIQTLTETKGRARLARSLILEPTRELALQVLQSFQAFSEESSLKAALLVGGESMIEQKKILSRGVDVLIATPGRLIDLIERGQLMLLGVHCVIIDEADRMLDMGFVPDINRLMSILPPKKQTLLFSATFPPEIKKLADTYLDNPADIHIAPQERTASTIKQFLVKIENLEKQQVIRHLLDKFLENRPGIIFCNRKKDISLLVNFLKSQGFQAEALHGDMTQSLRNEAVKRFKENHIKILVASDIAARGLDVENLGLVINCDIPRNIDDYVHRIGRTGRAGQEGFAFSLVSLSDKKLWQAVEKSIQQTVEVYQWKPEPQQKISASLKPQRNLLPSKVSNHKTSSLIAENIVGFGEFIPAFMLRPFLISELAQQ